MEDRQKKNMYEVRLLRDKIDEIIKPAFLSGQNVDMVKNMLLELLLNNQRGTMCHDEKQTLFTTHLPTGTSHL